MIATSELSRRFASFLGDEIEVVGDHRRISVMTPAEYPDCDGVTVTVDEDSSGLYRVSDMAMADSLVAGRIGPRALEKKAKVVAERFDVAFSHGALVTTVGEDGLPEACWRIAQASAALAEGVMFQPLDKITDSSFAQLVGSVLESSLVEVKKDAKLEGSSGYSHTASYFVPSTEAVVEPVAGRKALSRAHSVYTEFGDLRQVNGFQLVAVLDDQVDDLDKLSDLLSQVGEVALWSQRDAWIETVTHRRR